MKKQLFSGLFLIVLTLCSCSRKKTEKAENTETETAETAITTETTEEKSTTVDVIESQSIIEDNSEYDEDFFAEEERLGTEVLDFLENEANFSSPIIEETQVESVEKRLLDAYNRLKVMEFESEIFIPSKGINADSASVLVHYSKKAAVRLFYDDLYRLTKKEYWKMESVESAELSGTEKYSYEGESKKPYEKIIESDNAIFVSKLNENGLVIRTEKYASEAGSLNSVYPERVEGKGPIQTTVWTYDDKNRITSETVTEGKLVKKQVFAYKNQISDATDESSEELPPDYEYYENGVLVTKTEYLKKGYYSTSIWFDSTNSVRTDYENYVKVRDVYFTNGVEKRVKNYE